MPIVWEVSVHSRILILKFSKTVVEKPIVYNLVKNHDLTFNILNAAILPQREGVMVLELTGLKKNFFEGIQYLKDMGVQVQNASQEVKRIQRQCTHCGACTAVCPTGALAVVRPEMSVEFDQKKCSICELCVPACPTRAMQIRPTNTIFFE
mgnify:CR=1 FL=1